MSEAIKERIATTMKCQRALTWTAEKPKRSGWWWVRKGPYQFAVCVDVLLGALTVYTPWVGCCPLSDFNAEWWAGPLPGPPEPSPEATRQNAGIQRPPQ